MGWINSPQSRSIQVNGHLLAYYRKQRGWTQREAALASGYSIRLIRKAEAGCALHPDTIEVLDVKVDTQAIATYLRLAAKTVK